ncbi:gluconate 2-dehydrogenase subunit 3 family protein [Gemmobacter fulvus]|uniref:gluconate 2-dehydrogenase subunit 3 family protein n=1 Tax=Gemmobacter fulvus TaxID=2840474 RepID=UPI0027967719|nr:gluconate 2-dehydrogenase subunit 3 family protein [Gemmobacter fulvus]MDQ1849586.1 gluconate 2-dehydrogenase subunit 3 family protein [Gemmobacter fulvus]
MLHFLTRRRPAPRAKARLSRRGFLLSSALASVAVASLGQGTAWAGPALGPDAAATLLRMTQDIYPHPTLVEPEHYQAIADALMTEAETDAEVKTLLADGLTALDAQATALHGSAFAAVADADAREALLRAVQHGAFFQKIRWATYFGIYDNKALWARFNYEGSSWEEGGYADRGFSDITWVPQGPSEADRLAAVQ